MARLILCVIVLSWVGCGGDDDPAGGRTDSGAQVDSGNAGDGATGNDSGGDDASVSADGDVPQDGGGTDTDGGDTNTDGGPLMCMAGVECTGFPTSGFPTDASSVDNCVGHLHQTDCCGARRAFGINHGARDTLCPAEDACVAQYSASACDDGTITTDTGDTTTVVDEVRVRCAPGGGTCECQTFVCTEANCLASSRPIGSCG